MRKIPVALAGGLWALLLFAGAPAMADDASATNCDDGVSNAELGACFDAEYKAADAALNAVYKKVLAAAVEGDKQWVEDNPSDDPHTEVTTLKKAQRAWIDYRDGNCDMAGFKARGGTLEPLEVLRCSTELTRKRVAELKSFLETP